MIYFAFQDWNVDHGWWNPNMIPKDFIIGGEKQVPYTHGWQWFLVDTFPSLTNTVDPFAFPANKTDFLYDHLGIYYSYLPELTDKKYIFPVMIREPNFFNNMKDHGFNFVDEQVFNDVQQNRARIVFVFPFEGTSGSHAWDQDFNILDQWCKQKNLKKHQVFYIHANQRGLELCQDLDFTYVYVEPFVCWIPYLRHQPVLQDPEKLFLSYNRQPRQHRTLLVCELIKADLIKNGIVSYYGDNLKNTVERINHYQRPDLTAASTILDELIPLEIDMNLQENNPASNIVDEHYSKTFLSLVSETLFDASTIFFSEKIWKPISVGHPLMLVSSPGMLKELRNRGYYTFGSWWDESYDTILDVNERIFRVVGELKRLSQYSTEQLRNMRESMQPVLEHNQRRFNTQHANDCSIHPLRVLYRAVKDIWNSF